MTEWWTFERYGKKGAMARVDATIDALHLLAIKQPKSLPPPPPAAAASEEEKPALVFPSPDGRTPKAAAHSDVDSLIGRRTTSDRRRIGETVVDIPDEEEAKGEEDEELLSAEERARRRARADEDLFDDRPLLQLNHVTRTPGELQMSKEEQVYGRTNIHLLVESPATDLYPIDPVEEGFYAPDRPDVSLWNKDKLVARLTREDRHQRVFFEGTDRHLKMEAYPVCESAMRSADTELYAAEARLRTSVIVPAPYTGKDRWFDFRLDLGWVEFVDHTLFTREDRLCRDLEELCAEHRRRETIGLVQHYESKLKGLRGLLQTQIADAASWERAQLANDPDPTHLDAGVVVALQQKQLETLTQIRSCLDARELEEHELRVLFKQIYAKWMDIRATRSEATRNMKRLGFWNEELQPVPQTARAATATTAAESVPAEPAAHTGTGVNAAAAAAAAATQAPLSVITDPLSAQQPYPLPSPPSQGTLGYPGYPLASPSYPAYPAYPFPPAALDVSSPVALASPSGAFSPDATGASPLVDTLSSPSHAADAHAAQAAERLRQQLGDSDAARTPFTVPPPPPPAPPEIPPPIDANAALLTQQQLNDAAVYNPSPSPSPRALPTYDPAAMQQYMEQQQQAAAAMQQQQYAAAYDPALLQQQHEQMTAYQQQQAAAYQQFLAAQQQAATGQHVMASPIREETKEQGLAQPPPSVEELVAPKDGKKGRHLTIQETMALEQARIERERAEATGAAADAPASSRPNLTVVTGATTTLTSDDLLSVRGRGDLGLERRAGLLKETYIGYPSNLKVGRHQLDWKRRAEDTAVYRAEKTTWNDQIRDEMRETKMRARLERAIANGGVEPPPSEPLTPEQERLADAALRDTIESRMSSLRRRPGGTKYLPVYNEDLRVLEVGRCLAEEQARRRLIESYRIFLRVFVNGQRVVDTASVALSFPKFRAVFAQTIPLRLVAMPSSITIQIFHARGLLASDVPLAELGLPVPEYGAMPSAQQYSFAGAHIAPESAVMRHVPTPKEPFGPSRYTRGVLEASVAWVVDTAKKDGSGDGGDDAPESFAQLQAQLGSADESGRRATRNKMVDLLAAGGGRAAKNVDPNDPRNADLLEYMHRATAVRGDHVRGTFTATESQVEGRLTHAKYHQPSARSLVLAARNESGFIRDPVPLRDEDISAQLYSYIRVRDEASETAYERFAAKALPDTQTMYEREQMRAQAKILNVQHDVHDVGEVVNERALPVLSVDMAWLDALFQKRRDLRPRREVHKAVAAPKTCNIVVQVVKGQNLPVRRAERTAAGRDSAHAAAAGNSAAMSLEAQSNVRTFVEISLQDTCKRTTCSRGANPHWDQLVSLPFRPPAQSFSPAYLSTCTDVVAFNVFDEITASEEVDPRLTRTRLHRSEQRWLGSFSIPFTTIYNAGSVDGAFAVQVPPHLLGYEQPQADRDAVLFVYATMDPVLATPPDRPDRFHHMNPFYARAIEWVADLKSRSASFSKRAYMAVAGDISSQPQFICRYVTAERPPDKYQSPNIFTRFVATIPFQEDAQASLGTVKDIWCTSKEFLALQGGDWEEHAILLTNYFTWYDANLADASSRHQNYVALGSAFPEGDTAYVLRLGVAGGAVQSTLLVNAVTGRVYDLTNAEQCAACPMHSLALVFNADNIWANVQADANPTRCTFDLFNPKSWQPFFTGDDFNRETSARQYAMRFDTIQKPIAYTEEPLTWYVERAAKIERMVERRFEKWRALATHWDYGVCKVLRECLLSFETHAQREEVSIGLDKPMTAIKNAYASIYGFPLHFNDSGDRRLVEATDDNPILAAVRNTKMHENEDANAVFALAVYVHPYPNRMGSVWLYIATLKEK